MRWVRQSRLVAAVFLLVLLLPFTAKSDEQMRVFLRFSGPLAAKVSVLEVAFEAPILAETKVRFAGTKEMDAVYAECREQIGVATAVERECELMAARRIFVEQIIDIAANKTDKGGVRLTLSVWSTDDNAKIFGALIAVPSTSDADLEEGLQSLARDYLCHRGLKRHCPDGDAPAAEEPLTKPDPSEPVAITPQQDLQGSKGPTRIHADSGRPINFLQHSRGEWTLHRRDGDLVCVLPCTRDVPSDSGYYLMGHRVDSGEPREIRVPRDIGYGQEPMDARIDLDDDWQTWEITSLILLGSSLVVTGIGMGLFLANANDDERGVAFGAGIAAYAVGGITLTIVTPVYALWHWVKSPGKDMLYLEAAEQQKAMSLQFTTTF